MNPRLARRPLDSKRKLPVPYVQLIQPDGNADYRSIDGMKVIECAREGLCGLCGEALTCWIAFIGGPGSATARSYADPPMHVECAEDAMTLCPHIRRPLVVRRPPSENATIPVGFSDDKPERWALYVTRAFTWKMMHAQEGGFVPVFLPATPKQIRWWEYRDGVAVEVTEQGGSNGAVPAKR